MGLCSLVDSRGDLALAGRAQSTAQVAFSVEIQGFSSDDIENEIATGPRIETFGGSIDMQRRFCKVELSFSGYTSS